MGAWIILELSAGDLGSAVRTITASGIPLYDIAQNSDLSATFRINKKDYGSIQHMAKRKGWTVRILERKGLFWLMRRIFMRPALVGVLGLILMISIFLPGKVLLVEVEGNERIPEKRILEAARQSGIGFWADRRQVRSEKMKNALLGALPELQWAGVNTYGSRAVITVRERAEEAQQQAQFGVSSVVAARDGVILSTVATRGSCVVTPGQAVREGELLISGVMDYGLTVRMTQAEGEIFAQTRRNLTVKTLQEQDQRTRKGSTTEKYSLIIGKKRINFYKGSGISDSSCVKMYSEYVLMLPGGFALPLSIVKESVTEFDLTPCAQEEEAVFAGLSDFAQKYLQQLMVAGVIVSREEEVLPDQGWVLEGSYECQEMIGRVKPEEIGVYNGKTD